MNDFLNQLYSNEHFSMYLFVAIILLVIVFLLILFLGKKDKQLEETKRLEKLNQDGVKSEENKISEGIVTDEVKEEVHMPDILITNPNDNVYEANKKVENDVVEDVPVISQNNEEQVENKDDDLMIQFENNNDAPLLSSDEEKPLVFDNIPTEDNNDVDEMISIPNPESVKATIFTPDEKVQEKEQKETIVENKTIPEVTIPDFSFDDLESSLNEEYKNEEKKSENVIDMQPRSTGYEGTLNSPKIFSSVFVNEQKEEKKVTDDVDDMDLPELKKEEPILDDNNQNSTFNLESISGETYNLK
jgi:CBS domain-containing protein